jgi:hypothetical protein
LTPDFVARQESHEDSDKTDWHRREWRRAELLRASSKATGIM